MGCVQNKLNETPSAGHAACKICVSTAKYQDKHYTSPNPLPNSRHWDTIYFLICFILFNLFWFHRIHTFVLMIWKLISDSSRWFSYCLTFYAGNFREWSQSSLVPSGELTVCYWKWPSRNSGFSHEKWWIFPWQNVSSPEGNHPIPPFSSDPWGAHEIVTETPEIEKRPPAGQRRMLAFSLAFFGAAVVWPNRKTMRCPK